MEYIKRFTLALFLIPLFITCQEERQRPVYEYVMENVAETGARFPNLHQDDTGKIYMSWILDIEDDIYAIQFAEYENERWYAPRTVHVGTGLFVNWADFPSVVGRDGKMVAAHWLKKVEGGRFAYHVNMTFPGDSARRWTPPVTPHLDGTPTEHGFVSLEPISEDRVLAIWLDGRHTDGRGHHEYEDFDKSMTLRSAEITRDGEITRKRVIDDAVCDCCQTDLIPVEGGFLAVYRNRSREEIRDMYIARYSLETGEWSTPVPVWNDGWEIRACPVNGPRIVANGDTVAVAWFTMADQKPRVQLAKSTDGGRSFQDPAEIAGEESIGRVDLAMTEDGAVFVSWMNQREEAGLIMLREVTPDDQLREPVLAGITSSSRNSGFPRIKNTGDAIFMAWTQTQPQMRIRTAKVPIR